MQEGIKKVKNFLRELKRGEGRTKGKPLNMGVAQNSPAGKEETLCAEKEHNNPKKKRQENQNPRKTKAGEDSKMTQISGGGRGAVEIFEKNNRSEARGSTWEDLGKWVS